MAVEEGPEALEAGVHLAEVQRIKSEGDYEAALEVARKGITVNAVAPGFIQTAMTEVLTDQQKQMISGRIPAGGAGTAGTGGDDGTVAHRSVGRRPDGPAHRVGGDGEAPNALSPSASPQATAPSRTSARTTRPSRSSTRAVLRPHSRAHLATAASRCVREPFSACPMSAQLMPP